MKAIRAAELPELNALAVDKTPMNAAAIDTAFAPFLNGGARLVMNAGDFTLLGDQYHAASGPRILFSQTTLGAIGWGVPFALGVKAALPDERVFLLVGDGSFGFNGMEFNAAVRHRLPIITAMGNDAC